jgi:hypothetical protein
MLVIAGGESKHSKEKWEIGILLNSEPCCDYIRLYLYLYICIYKKFIKLYLSRMHLLLKIQFCIPFCLKLKGLIYKKNIKGVLNAARY